MRGILPTASAGVLPAGGASRHSAVITARDAAGTGTDFTYDLLSRAIRTVRKPDTGDSSKDTVTDLAYDDDSRVTRRSIAENPGTWTSWQDTDYLYDERLRVVTLRRPDGDIWNNRYDLNGNRIGWTDPLGTSVTDTTNPTGGSTLKPKCHAVYRRLAPCASTRARSRQVPCSASNSARA